MENIKKQNKTNEILKMLDIKPYELFEQKNYGGIYLFDNQCNLKILVDAQDTSILDFINGTNEIIKKVVVSDNEIEYLEKQKYEKPKIIAESKNINKNICTK